MEKSASLLRTMSSMKILGSADGSVHALPISRDRLSNGGLRPINDSDIGPYVPRPSGLGRPRPSALGTLAENDKRASMPLSDVARRSGEKANGGRSSGQRPRSNSERTSNKSAGERDEGRPRSRIISNGRDHKVDLDLLLGSKQHKLSF